MRRPLRFNTLLEGRCVPQFMRRPLRSPIYEKTVAFPNLWEDRCVSTLYEKAVAFQHFTRRPLRSHLCVHLISRFVTTVSFRDSFLNPLYNVFAWYMVGVSLFPFYELFVIIDKMWVYNATAHGNTVYSKAFLCVFFDYNLTTSKHHLNRSLFRYD